MSRRFRLAPWFVLAALVSGVAGAHEGAPDPVHLYFFWGDGCPYCAQQEVFHETLVAEYPNVVIHDFEVWNDADNRELMAAMAAAFSRPVTGVPMTFIGDEAWTGFSDTIAAQLRSAVGRYSGYQGPDAADRLDPVLRAQMAPVQAAASTFSITVPFVGEVALGSQSLVIATALIGFTDGVNPCSLWVIAVLMAMVVHTRSRRRVLLVGLTFLTVAAAAYGAFMVGLFNVLAYVGYLDALRVVVALLAAFVAFVSLKDYVAFKQGFSLTIDDAQKPGLYARMRRVARGDRGLPATLAATAGLALGVTLIELPCTAGLPVVWTTIVTDAGVGAAAFGVLLAIYLLLFLLDELIVFGTVVTTMRVLRVEEREGRVLKLLGGAIMLVLAGVMLLRPSLLESVTGTFAVFGGALAAVLVILVGHHLLFPASSPFTGLRGRVTASDAAKAVAGAPGTRSAGERSARREP